MPTPEQIDAAEDKLTPDANGALTAKAADDLFVFLRKFLYDTKRSAGYTGLKAKIAAATGRSAAQLQAALDNVSGVGSKVAKMVGEINFDTQENINNELEFALFVLYEPVAQQSMGTQQSDIAVSIRSMFGCICGGGLCRCDNSEWRRTVSRC